MFYEFVCHYLSLYTFYQISDQLDKYKYSGKIICLFYILFLYLFCLRQNTESKATPTTSKAVMNAHKRPEQPCRNNKVKVLLPIILSVHVRSRAYDIHQNTIVLFPSLLINDQYFI